MCLFFLPHYFWLSTHDQALCPWVTVAENTGFRFLRQYSGGEEGPAGAWEGDAGDQQEYEEKKEEEEEENMRKEEAKIMIASKDEEFGVEEKQV